MKTIVMGATLAALLGLTACGNGDSAVETRDRAQETPSSLMSATVSEGAGDVAASAAKTPAPLTANRRETVDEKIQRLYERNGADFGARSPEDFLAKITAFTTSPPSDTDRATRPNGDILLYQASTNTFAVVDREGTPRTMFKPDEGEAYWAEQKAAAPTFGQRRSNG